MSSGSYSPLWQLTVARLREFFRVPEAIFWVYGFPLLLAIALGIAFRERPVERIKIDLLEDTTLSTHLQTLAETLKTDSRLEVIRTAEEDWRKRLRAGKTDLVVVVKVNEGKPDYEFWDEPNRPESVLARNAVQNVLLKQVQSPSVPTITERHLEEIGVRYIDFLIPGLLGMNLMGGGLFGVGFVIVDMRVRKLLKRFLATPMQRRDFLLSIMLSRLIFAIPEVLMLLAAGYLLFGVANQGNLLELIAMICIGGASFAGVGLLVACRAKTIETVSGLMNLVMLPMWVLSGVFFSSERFPAEAQPFIQILPLTALNDSLRGIMLEGKSLYQLGSEVAILTIWGIVSFAIALRFFRWK